MIETPGLDQAKVAPAHHDVAGPGFIAQSRSVVGDAADRGVADINAIAFTRDFPSPFAEV